MTWPHEIAVADREALMREMEARWQALNALVAGLSEAQLRLSVPRDDEATARWDVGVAVAHLAFWKRNATLVAELQGEPFDPDDRFPPFILGLDLNPVNDGLAERWRGRPGPEVKAEHADAHQALLAAVAGLPDRALIVNGHPVAWLHPALGHTETHFQRHIKAVLEQPG